MPAETASTPGVAVEKFGAHPPVWQSCFRPPVWQAEVPSMTNTENRDRPGSEGA
jgi:hypothetical protein